MEFIKWIPCTLKFSTIIILFELRTFSAQCWSFPFFWNKFLARLRVFITNHIVVHLAFVCKALNCFSVWSIGVTYKSIVILNNRELSVAKMFTIGTSIHFFSPIIFHGNVGMVLYVTSECSSPLSSAPLRLNSARQIMLDIYKHHCAVLYPRLAPVISCYAIFCSLGEKISFFSS